MQKSIHKMQVLLIACNRVIPAKPFVLSPGEEWVGNLKKEVWLGVCRRGLQTLILVKTKPAYFASLLDKRLFCIAQIYFIYKKILLGFFDFECECILDL